LLGSAAPEKLEPSVASNIATSKLAASTFAERHSQMLSMLRENNIRHETIGTTSFPLWLTNNNQGTADYDPRETSYDTTVTGRLQRFGHSLPKVLLR